MRGFQKSTRVRINRAIDCNVQRSVDPQNTDRKLHQPRSLLRRIRCAFFYILFNTAILLLCLAIGFEIIWEHVH